MNFNKVYLACVVCIQCSVYQLIQLKNKPFPKKKDLNDKGSGSSSCNLDPNRSFCRVFLYMGLRSFKNYIIHVQRFWLPTFMDILCTIYPNPVKVSRSQNMKQKIYEILTSPKIQTNDVILNNCID